MALQTLLINIHATDMSCRKKINILLLLLLLTEDVGDELDVNSEEVQMLKQIIKPTASGQPSTTPKSGDKRGSTHLDGDSGSSDSSGEDLDASRGAQTKKKTSMPTKALHPNQWSKEDIDIMRQIPLQDGSPAISRPIVPTKLLLLTSPQ